MYCQYNKYNKNESIDIPINQASAVTAVYEFISEPGMDGT